ncbi:NAD(P)/FAD-dependent oxidoreductase [Aquisalimonas sp.]|uniref:flavin-containing monooxygenase n=1 Tax=Aquisalimonas sp. TaxID=1872621 RepID=UPI0025C6C7BF|nr:NAD(P)/FAD-dependent oxidoreductase [Aquisalimonas sp.]
MCPTTAGLSTTRETRVAIIGAGFSGLGMAIRLRQAGIDDFLVLERAADIGGTWRDNSYPGCAVDVKAHLYSLSFAPNADWTETYASQREIWDYIKRVCAEHGVLPHVRLGAEVRSGLWDDAAQRWRLETSTGVIEAQFLVSAIGPLSEPALPETPGLESFEGRLFHSAQWDHNHELSGKRVGVIGTGSSAAQFIPKIQPTVEKLTVFQRTPHWTFPRMNRRITKLEQMLYRRFPALQRAVRARQYLYHEFLGFMVQHSRLLEAVAMLRLRLHVRDPELRTKLTPDYRMGCKRIVVSDDFHPVLMQPNVDVVTEKIVEISPRGVLTADGAEHALDTLILGTGFRAMPVVDPLRGRDGDTLTERWREGRCAYYGTTVAGFPNYFMLVGPNTATGHTSVLLYAEAQIGYIVQALQYLERHQKTSLEVAESAQRFFNDHLRRKLKRTVWLTGGCNSWYLNDPNGTSVLWPGYTWSFRKALRRFDAENYVLRDAARCVQPGHAHSTRRPLASQSS